jgi:hypothetical protein
MEPAWSVRQTLADLFDQVLTAERLVGDHQVMSHGATSYWP